MRAVALFAAFVLVGCSHTSTGSAVLRSAPTHPASADASTIRGASQAQRDSEQAQFDKIKVITTFSTLNSFVEGVGGDLVQVQNLVPVGASPEDYQPAPQDIAALSDAQLVVENGTGIEVWLNRTIADSATKARILVLSDGLPHIDHNPHLWMDPVNVRAYVNKIRDSLSALDPAHKQRYASNARAYNAKVGALRSWISGQIRTIPASQRNMIIFHNAFDYYNKRFGIRTIGVIELSPGQDPNPQYIAHLVDLARANNVRAVFSEPEYSPKLAQNLARSANVRVVTDLYDDSIGNDPRVGDYISMLRYDTGVIVKSLK